MDDLDMPIDVERRLLKWGNGFGLRLTAAEVKELGLAAGDVVHAELRRPSLDRKALLAKVKTYALGHIDPAELDRMYGEAVWADQVRATRIRRPRARTAKGRT